MNYYDEEIVISGADSKNLSSVKMERLPSGRTSGSSLNRGVGLAAGGASSHYSGNKRRQRSMLHGNSMTDDDGLLQDIIDHDDDEDDDGDDSEDDSDLQQAKPRLVGGVTATVGGNTNSGRPRTRPGSARGAVPAAAIGGGASGGFPTAKALANDSDHTDSDSEGVMGQSNLARRISGAASGHAPTADAQLSITPEQWEQLALPQELKDIFPYILKYTPQSIDTPFHLQPFIPEYVPAVGDVDAMLKVMAPALLQPQRQQEINEHMQRMGIYLLDEPSGTQSEPSLLNMKLRSVLGGGSSAQRRADSGTAAAASAATGTINKRRSASATLIPTAKSPKDIDKWITEVEQVHMNQSIYDAAPRKDIDVLLMDWPRAYAETTTLAATERAYQQTLQEQISLAEYVRTLSQQFGVEGPLETQADYILNVQTLFALYLAASQAWE